MQLNDIASSLPSSSPSSTGTSAASSSSSSQSSSSTSSTQTLNENDFLQMLVTELQNQDPTNPLQSTDLAAQLAQFSSVSELQTLNSNVQNSTNANLLMTQSISNTMAATLIGKQVKINTSQISFDGSTKPTLGFSLSSSAADVQVKIMNSDGTVVRTIDEGPMASGDNTATWDGKDDSGNSLSAGNYSFSVNATDSQGNQLSPSLYILGTVQGVKFSSSGASLLVDGTSVNFSDVQEIFGN
jgi:flagellar basal-body rod modification protein FlgD